MIPPNVITVMMIIALLWFVVGIVVLVVLRLQEPNSSRYDRYVEFIPFNLMIGGVLLLVPAMLLLANKLV